MSYIILDNVSIRGYTDDILGDAVPLYAGATAQNHNFHDNGDQDWTIFALGDRQGVDISTTQLGLASAQIVVYRISPFPTEVSPGRWNIPLNNLIQIGSDMSSGNNAITIQNTTGTVQGYVIKTISSGTYGFDTNYQIKGVVNNL